MRTKPGSSRSSDVPGLSTVSSSRVAPTAAASARAPDASSAMSYNRKVRSFNAANSRIQMPFNGCTKGLIGSGSHGGGDGGGSGGPRTRSCTPQAASFATAAAICRRTS
ncbi:hypothetical protein Vafri_5313 [Volvox africanus]|uniref:Uncharacterized protein n=1 Tax=Volvox africanus TaxID=51714 RepID=A0A8J4AVS7_9CHLO|nr:hypothetical protein Vafri_5313 [Volvox africanus]